MWLTYSMWQLQQHLYLSVPGLSQSNRSAEKGSIPHGSTPDPTEVRENLPSMLSHFGSTANVEQTDHSYVDLSQQSRHMRKKLYPLPKVKIFRGKKSGFSLVSN